MLTSGSTTPQAVGMGLGRTARGGGGGKSLTAGTGPRADNEELPSRRDEGKGTPGDEEIREGALSVLVAAFSSMQAGSHWRTPKGSSGLGSSNHRLYLITGQQTPGIVI